MVWGPLLAVLSMATETTDDPKVVELCVEGFKHAVHCAGVLGMSTERAALVTALCNFTTLEPAGGGVRAGGTPHGVFPEVQLTHCHWRDCG